MRTTGVTLLATGTVGVLAGVLLAATQPGRDSPDPPPPLGAIELEASSERRPIVETVERAYALISGPAGERDWEAFEDLFAEHAQLVSVSAGPDGERSYVRMTPEEYAEQAGEVLRRRGFHERQIARRLEHYGGIAHVWSTYELRRGPGIDLDAEPDRRGINSFQLIKDPASGRWKILTILWDTETDAQPIPPEYLPARAPDRRE